MDESVLLAWIDATLPCVGVSMTLSHLIAIELICIKESCELYVKAELIICVFDHRLPVSKT